MSYEFSPAQLRWLEALESGNFKQSTAWLSRTEGFCCLGVACEIFKEELGLEKSRALINEYKSEWCESYSGFSNVLPGPVQALLKLRSPSGFFDANNWKNPCSLVQMNDVQRKSFQEIAQFIRENPEKVFVE